MIDITRDEMKYLMSKGVVFGEGGMCAGKSHHHGWWITESRDNMKLLNEYRRNKIIYTKSGNSYRKKKKGVN